MTTTVPRGFPGTSPCPTEDPATGNCDPMETLLPESENGRPATYEVGFLREDLRRFRDRSVWWVTFSVVEQGPHFGKRILWFMNKLRPGHRPPPSSAVARAFIAATGLRVPKDLGLARPSSFLSGCALLARVKTVRRDIDGVERPEGASYSVIKCFESRTAGAAGRGRRSH